VAEAMFMYGATVVGNTNGIQEHIIGLPGLFTRSK